MSDAKTLCIKCELFNSPWLIPRFQNITNKKKVWELLNPYGTGKLLRMRSNNLM